MMKKRMIALLLAGLMTTTALASCRVQNNNNNPNGTEPNQGSSSQTTTTKPDDPYIPPTVTWTEETQDIYTFKDTTLRKEANNTSAGLGSIPKELKLTSTKHNSSWYYVEYDGKQGYILKTTATKTNILGTDLLPVDGGSKTMYVKTDGLQKRFYPTDESFSTVLGSHSLNDVVTVTHTNNSWSRIQGENNQTYYLANKHLSETKVIDPDDITIYDGLFTEVNGNVGVEKYVRVDGNVNLRKAPNTKASIIMSLSDGVKVTVLKTGTVEDMAWSYIVVKVESDKAGVPSTYEYGYISSAYLTDTNGNMSLDEFIEYYGFSKIDGGMMYYVLKEERINIRSTPAFPNTEADEKDNLITTLQSGTTTENIKALKVVATGEVDGTAWFMVEFTMKEGDKEVATRGFVGGKALDSLTTDKNGERVVTLQDLANKYPKLTILETPETKVAKNAANCYGTDNTTGTVLGTIAVGTEVTVVATETGAFATWCVIQTEEGKLLFVGIEFFD